MCSLDLLPLDMKTFVDPEVSQELSSLAFPSDHERTEGVSKLAGSSGT